MNWIIPFGLGWCLAMSGIAVVYGEYTSHRQSQGCPITPAERNRNFFALYAIGISLASLAVMAWTQLPLWFVFQELTAVAGFALTPLILWYCFALPLRLVRHLAARSKAAPAAPHPLDGPRSDQASSLDRLNLRRDRLAALGTAATADDPPPPVAPRV